MDGNGSTDGGGASDPEQSDANHVADGEDAGEGANRKQRAGDGDDDASGEGGGAAAIGEGDVVAELCLPHDDRTAAMRQQTCAEFTQITSTDLSTAEHYLRHTAFDLERAVSLFYEGGLAPPPADDGEGGSEDEGHPDQNDIADEHTAAGDGDPISTRDALASSKSSESIKSAEGATMKKGEGESEGGGGARDNDESFEEECVICLEKLSSHPWGRCTPCNHAFHKKCWWEWENAHRKRIDRRRAREGRVDDGGPRCCLCNTVNKQFVDGAGAPAHNPAPFVASEDPAGEGGNRFTNWFREVSEGASGFIEALASELPFAPARAANAERGSGFFGPRRNSRRTRNARRASRPSPFAFSGANSPFGTTEVPPFAMPFFGNQPQFPQTFSGSNYSNTNPFNQMRPGTQVMTQHLDRRPDLNGQRGQILSYQPGSSRYLVQFHSNISNFITGSSSAAPVAIKPVNLLQTGVKVRIHGLQTQPQLNGKAGTVTAYSRERNRYVVQLNALLSPTREISLQPVNVRVGNGMCVRLEGLRRTPQWNGKYGTIVGWVEDESRSSGSGRYEVRLSRQYAVRVKMEHVRL